MRISTSQMYYKGTSNIINGQADVYKTQNQLSTGRKIQSPRDNPVDSTLALMTTQSKEVNKSFLTNQATANDHLAFMDTQLASVSELLQSALERSVQGGNGTYGAQQKQALAEDLKRQFEGLVDLANTKDGAGEYVFAGNRTNQQPFKVDGTGGNYSLVGPTKVSYAGDDGRRLLQVEASQTVATSASGQEVFMRVQDANGKLNGGSVFDAMQNMIDILDPGSGVTPLPDYSKTLGDLQDSLDHILRIRASVGASMNQMDSLTNSGSDLSLQYETRLASLEGLDYAEAISRLSQQQTQLQASQQSFVKTTQLKLFDLIS